MIYQSGWNDQFVIFHRNFLDLKRRIYKNHLRLLLLYINKKSLLIEKINSEFLLHYKLQIYKLLISSFTVHLILIIWKEMFTYIQIKTVIDVASLPLRKSLFSQKSFRTEEKYNTCTIQFYNTYFCIFRFQTSGCTVSYRFTVEFSIVITYFPRFPVSPLSDISVPSWKARRRPNKCKGSLPEEREATQVSNSIPSG